tara:strand:- start:478 stop:918 length:441 start_codon:yes stop_codon:yes gene_type:complete
MLKILILINLFLIIGCSKRNPIEYSNIRALKCGLKEQKSFKKYIFNKKTGKLYFYDSSQDEFIPLSNRFNTIDSIYINQEYISKVKGHKLIINEIDYLNEYPEEIFKLTRIINMKSLHERNIFRNKEGNLETKRLNCVWIDPKLGF